MKKLSDKTYELEASDARTGSMATLVAKIRANKKDGEHIVLRHSNGGPLINKQWVKDDKLVKKDTPGAQKRELRQRVFLTTDKNDPEIPNAKRGGGPRNPEVEKAATDILAKLRG